MAEKLTNKVLEESSLMILNILSQNLKQNR